MQRLDWLVVILYFIFSLTIGFLYKKRAEGSISDYFIGGRKITWWLAGISMVATTFAADTPLAVTGIVASQGIAGNWIWWNFALSGMFTTFFFARLWHRAGIMTDVEFTEIRYAGKSAAFLRGLRALYMAFPINCVILGWVTLGMVKVLQVISGIEVWQSILLLYTITTLYIFLSGIWGVVITDFFQFLIAIGGAIVLMFFALDKVGGMSELTAAFSSTNREYLSFSPLNNPKILLSTVLVWLGMQWWASWYPGAEPGGGGYIAQRMFSTKNEKEAVKSSLLFNIAHYAIRPWPWIITALVSMILYPGLSDPEKGYPLLMTQLLPPGIFGLLVVAFLAAFMSTVSTHLNWGASYVINDFYARFIKPRNQFPSEIDAEKHYVKVSRLMIVFIAVTGIMVSYFFDSVKSGWEMILSLGAGTGLVYMLRWYWWRINAWSEISAMIAAFIGVSISGLLGFGDFSEKMIFTALFTSGIWLTVTFLTPPEKKETLQKFYERVKPEGPGWKPFNQNRSFKPILSLLFNVVLGVLVIWGFLFGVGKLIFGEKMIAALYLGIAGLAFYGILSRLDKK